MTERWRKMVEKVQCGNETNGFFLFPDQAVKLLARQHRNIRDKVRTLRNRATMSQFQNMREVLVYRQACKDILAALAKQGGKK